MTIAYIIVAILVLIVLSGFFSGMEIAYVASSRLMLEIDKNKGGLRGYILGTLFHKPDTYIATMLVANNIVLVIYGLLMSYLIDPILEGLGIERWLLIILDSLIATFFIIVFGEYLPKSSFKNKPNRAMQRFALPIYFFYILLYPISAACAWLSKVLSHISGKKDENVLAPELTMVDLDYYLASNLSNQGKTRELETEVKIMQKAIDFSAIRARDCMIPRNEIVACSVNTDLQTLKEAFVRTGLSKIVVYRETIDEVIGYVHAQEVFLGDGWQNRMKKALLVPGSMYGHKLMAELMQRKRSLAVVVDELGGTAGIVTFEDLVEEIFGEIEDEHDTERIIYRKKDNDTYIFSGRAEIDEINERFDIGLPESDEYNTLAGLIINEHRSIPEKGEIVVIDKYTFRILRSSSTRIELIEMSISDA